MGLYTECWLHTAFKRSLGKYVVPRAEALPTLLGDVYGLRGVLGAAAPRSMHVTPESSLLPPADPYHQRV